MAAWGQPVPLLQFHVPIRPRSLCGTDLPIVRPARLDALFQPCAQTTFLRHSFDQTVTAGTGISTSCPSPTPCGLGLGPGLPWADEPSPGNLRFTAGRILTCLLAYLCQHSHFLSVHRSSRYGFCLIRTLPYHLRSGMWEVRCES